MFPRVKKEKNVNIMIGFENFKETEKYDKIKLKIRIYCKFKITYKNNL